MNQEKLLKLCPIVIETPVDHQYIEHECFFRLFSPYPQQLPKLYIYAKTCGVEYLSLKMESMRKLKFLMNERFREREKGRIKKLDEYRIKMCLIGSTGLKTDMVRCFTDTFIEPDKYDLRVGSLDLYPKKIQVDNNLIRLILAVPRTQAFFSKRYTWLLKQGWVLKPIYYRGASAGIITFDKGVRASFEAVNDWYKEFKKNIPDPRIPIALVGFITDSGEISTKEGQKLAAELQIPYYETKPTDKVTISRIFHNLTVRVLDEGIVRKIETDSPAPASK